VLDNPQEYYGDEDQYGGYSRENEYY
jgi:hypothetical protein